MDEITALEKQLKGLLRAQFTSVSISFNAHASSFVDARQNEEYGDFRHVSWVSEAEKAEALNTNSVWILHCYPDTPGGFYAIGASTLSACLEKTFAGASAG